MALLSNTADQTLKGDMKHFSEIRELRSGYSVIVLVDDIGDRVHAFDVFTEHVLQHGYAQQTVNRYQRAVALFLDYLTEAGALGKAVKSAELNKIVTSYPAVKFRADEIRAQEDGSDSFYAWARPIVRALDMKSCHSLDNTIAAINLFLQKANTAAWEDWEIAESYDYARPTGSYYALIKAIDGFERMPWTQRERLKQASLFETFSGGIKRPKRLRKPVNVIKEDYLDFPLDGLQPLVDAATTWRDRALWLLLAGTGLRMSEAVNISWAQIDISGQRVFVEDPYALRFSKDLPQAFRHRFKGRATSETVFIPQLKQPFFDALEKYARLEYIAGVSHDLVFQRLHPPRAGTPMRDMSDTSRIEGFRRAVARAGVVHPHPNGYWTPHSLRHLYGVFMLNYLPVPGGFGLQAHEVQQCMGHRTQKATEHYARQNRAVLETKLDFADAHMSDTLSEFDLQTMPQAIAKRLRHEADRIEEIADDR